MNLNDDFQEQNKNPAEELFKILNAMHNTAGETANPQNVLGVWILKCPKCESTIEAPGTLEEIKTILCNQCWRDFMAKHIPTMGIIKKIK